MQSLSSASSANVCLVYRERKILSQYLESCWGASWKTAGVPRQTSPSTRIRICVRGFFQHKCSSSSSRYHVSSNKLPRRVAKSTFLASTGNDPSGGLYHVMSACCRVVVNACKVPVAMECPMGQHDATHVMTMIVTTTTTCA